MSALSPPQEGFSLVELAVVLAVTAILAAIALPSYHNHVAATRRTQARAALVQTALWLERMATATGRYPDSSAVPLSMLKTDGGHYQLSVDAQATAFNISATPAGGPYSDRCGTLGLKHTGERTISGTTHDATVDTCWGR